ncbi:MAG: hypothetical protein J6U01_11160 [Clostridia bacterium]|nr:hypothetical protein [Clostridia bacterium]
MKRLLIGLLILALLLPIAVSAETGPVAYMYTFEAGDALEGEGATILQELLDAIQIRMTRQNGKEENLYQIELISEGKSAFTLLVQDSANGEYSLTCSLLGKNRLKLEKEQITDFLRTLVQVLADLNVLKGESLAKIDGLAVRAGNLLSRLERSNDDDMSLDGLDLTPYLMVLTKYATQAEHVEMPADNEICPGAVGAWHYQLAEEDLSALVDSALNKLMSIPVINDELKSGRLRIGKQIITDSFIRTLFGAMHGDTTLDLYEDDRGQMVQMILHIPDLVSLMNKPELNGLITDPNFARISGISITIDRIRGEGVALTSDTQIQILGIDRKLMGVRLDRMAGEKIVVKEAKKTYEVGELNSQELWDLLKSMWSTILFHAADFVLDLPRCVFDLIIGKFSLF